MSARNTFILAGLIVALPLSACGKPNGGASAAGATTTVTVTEQSGATPPRATDVLNASGQWAGGPDGTGIFTVGGKPAAGKAASIPPGLYSIRVKPGAEHGHWMICDSELCGPGFEEHAAVVGIPVGQESSRLYIGPQAHTLWVDDVVISPLVD